MDDERPTSSDQATHWNGPAGEAWVEAQAVLDAMFAPFATMLVEAAAAAAGGRVLDVGCGTGGTTLAIARRLGDGGRCLGVDISAPMIAAARARAERDGVPAAFICADAARHPFEPRSVDIVVSRFGVMFFEDPVGAFANLRSAGRPGAGLAAIAWRSPAENPFMTTAERAAAPLLPEMPARPPGGPGQFAFADAERTRRILEESGWRDVEVRPIDVACALPEAELTRYVTRLGPLGRVLREADAATRDRIVATVRPAFAPFVDGETVRFTAACWMIRAEAP